MGRPPPALLPQHLMQRNPNQPPIGLPGNLRAPGAFAAFQQQQQQSHAQYHPQQQQQSPHELQAQLQQVLELQARQSAKHRRQHQQRLLDQMHSQSEPAQPRTPAAGASTLGAARDTPVWSGSHISPDAAMRAEQHRQLAEMLAGSSLHQHDSGLSQHSNNMLYGGSQASHDHMHRLASLGGASSYDPAHRLTSLGAVSSPEQPYRLTSLSGHAHEHAYRLSSLGAAGSSDARAAFRDGASQLRQYPSAPIPEDAGIQQDGRQSQGHEWDRQL